MEHGLGDAALAAARGVRGRLAFGGLVNTHEEDDHPWLREENMLIRRLLDRGVPMLGICLGGQLMAKAVNAPVTSGRSRRSASTRSG